MILWPPSTHLWSTIALLGAATGAGIGGLGAASAMESADGEPSPAAWAIAYSVMTASMTLCALRRDPPMTVAAFAGCSCANVCAATFGLGVVLAVARRSSNLVRVPVSRRAGLLLPVSLMLLLIGFGGILHAGHAVILVLEGAVLLPMCVRPTPPVRWPAVLQFVIGLCVMALCGWIAMTAAAHLASTNPILRPGVLSALVLGPVVVLPMVPSIATLAENGHNAAAVDALVLFIVINCCGVIPLLAAVRPDIAIPMLNWRLDTVLLTAVGLILLPPSTRHWSLGRTEGLALVIVFVAFLIITLLVTFQ
ncbi:MAG: hypothetical protein JO353_13805 [Phycisphaerae bacterium]|nr:hypothetical protein [Phycisphaerae bacterium]